MKTTVFLFLASAVVQMVLTLNRGKQLSFGETIGGAIALMLVPCLGTLLVKWSFQFYAWVVGSSTSSIASGHSSLPS